MIKFGKTGFIVWIGKAARRKSRRTGQTIVSQNQAISKQLETMCI